MKRALFCIVIGAMVFAAGAGRAGAGQATPDASPAAAAGIPPITWQLTEAALADGTVHTPDDPSRYTIQFLPDGTVAALADCNQAGGSYEIDGPLLSIPDLRSTLVGCPEGSLGSDYTFWLSQVTEFELAEDALILSLEDGGTLRFAPALGGVTWEWQQYQGGDDSMVTPDQPDDYTLRFEADDHVLVRADCNIGSGSAVIEGETIDIDGIALTRMYCGDASLDRDFLRYLEETTSFLFVDGQLALVLPMDAGTLLFAARIIEDDDTEMAADGTPESE